MLQNIKSSYFIKLIYTFVEEAQKLKLVRYNKSIQKNLDINIINYKFFTGNYTVYESNKIRKDYNGEYDTLIFEGEYLNGERNGKGKEYDGLNGVLIYEGEYLNGKRNGEGKEYDEQGQLCYEGNYYNGKRHGKGREYYYFDGGLKFEGEFINNKEWIGKRYDFSSNLLYELNNNINGKGKEYNLDGKLIFEGEYLNGKRNGKGKEYNHDCKLLFEGEYYNDLKWNGRGYDLYNNIIYELKDGKGLVKEYDIFQDKITFEGEYINGKRNGKGKEYHKYKGIVY